VASLASIIRVVRTNRTPATAIIAMPTTMSATPSYRPSGPANRSVRIVCPTSEAAVLVSARMNKLNFSMTKPKAITAIPVRIQARKVRSLAECSVANRHGHRDATMILVAFRHRLRASELCDLRWDQIEFNAAAEHPPPARGRELRALRRLQRESETRVQA
jgi:integrase